MPERENVLCGVNVAVVRDTTRTTGPFSYSKPCDTSRPRIGQCATIRTGFGGVLRAISLRSRTCLSRTRTFRVFVCFISVQIYSICKKKASNANALRAYILHLKEEVFRAIWIICSLLRICENRRYITPTKTPGGRRESSGALL